MVDKKMAMQLVVIGGGPGGYAAAFLAADMGMKVTLVDPDKNPGGVCLYRGCIPSKALLHVAKLIHEASEAEAWGVHFEKPSFDLDRIRAWKDEVVDKLTGGVGQLTKQRKITHIRGMAKFIDANTISIDKVGGGSESLTFEHAILASGSEPARIPGFPESPNILDSTTALDLENIPKTLLVIGGGYIGLELGTVYASLGSKVTLVEMTSGLLPGVDRDLVNVLQKRITSLFDTVLLNTKVSDLKDQKNGLKASFEGKGADKQSGQFEKVLVSVGRRPLSANLGLENTKIQLTQRGFVKVDEQLRTDEPSIFAIGDVVGEPMLAHKASHEGRTAVEAIAGQKVAFEPHAIPAVVFTDPEIAWCGTTESEAKSKGQQISVAKFPWGASGRAATLGRSDGLTKLIIDPETERVLGLGLVGPGAGELIAEGVVAIEMGALASDIGLSIHPHPTLSETIMEAADLFYGTSTHYYRPKRR
ncbi:MAG TPA: dihydrolipoyl dehydrogenase [candidate division Zixibacteria bacterium]|nr:dihydrolipoyl dehydrogenase [candidate division Zixibacteria bacterium]